MKTKRRIIAALMSVMLGFSLVASTGLKPVSAIDKTSESVKLAQRATNAKLFERIGVKDKSINENEVVRVIVQLDKGGAKAGRSAATVSTDQQSVRNAIEAKIGDVTFRQAFGYLLSGFSLECKRGDMPKIAAIPGVKDVREAVSFKMTDASSNGMIGANKVQTDYGIKGTGTLVSIIDTGVDAAHTDMRLTDVSKAMYPNQAAVTAKVAEQGLPGSWVSDKVPYGYDYADNIQNSKALFGSSPHGMHVAGISAANTNKPGNTGVTGVAPEAQVLAMKVFSNYAPTCWSDDTIRAIEDSVKLGADVINMSLGSTCGFTDANDAYFKSIQAASDAGVVVCIAAGNDGTAYSFGGTNRIENLDFNALLDDANRQELSVHGSPAGQIDCLAVASADNNVSLKAYFTLTIVGGANNGNIHRLYAYEQEEPTTGRTFVNDTDVAVFNCNKGQTDADFATAKAYGEGAGTPKWYALIERGAISFKEKATNAKANGASGVLVYNNAPGDASFGMAEIEQAGLSSLFLAQATGQQVIANINEGGENRAMINIPPAGTTEAVVSDTTSMSSFTSWGPAENLAFKPEITAPGGGIRSTVNDEKYQNMSGTSMATPHVAGVVALLKEAFKSKPELAELSGIELVRFMKDTMTNTAQPIIDATNNLPYSPRVAGAGMVSVPRAIDNRVIATYDGRGTAALKHIASGSTFTVKLHNYSDTEQTFTVAPGTVYTTEIVDNKPVSKALEMTLDAGETNITVPAKGDKEVTFTFAGTAPTKSFAEGQIVFTSATDGEQGKQPTIRMTYMGYVGNWATDYRWGDAPLTERPFMLNDVYGKTFFDFTTTLTVPFEESGEMYQIPAGNYFETDNATGASGYKASTVGFNPDAETSNNVTPQVWMFRNTPRITGTVVDASGTVVANLGEAVNVRKHPFFMVSPMGPEESARKLSELNWDGYVYDPTTGKNKIAADGQYTVKLQSSWKNLDNAGADSVNPGRLIEMPVKIDTVAPTAEFNGTPTYDRATDTLTMVVKSTDAGTGVAQDGFVVASLIDEKLGVLEGIEVTAGADDTYTVKVPNCKAQVKHKTFKPTIVLATQDYAFNLSEVLTHEFDLYDESLLKFKDGTVLSGGVGINASDLTRLGATVETVDTNKQVTLPVTYTATSNVVNGGFILRPITPTPGQNVDCVKDLDSTKSFEEQVKLWDGGRYHFEKFESFDSTTNTGLIECLVDLNAPTIDTGAQLSTNAAGQKYIKLNAAGQATLNVTYADTTLVPADSTNFVNLKYAFIDGENETTKAELKSGLSATATYALTENSGLYKPCKLQVHDAVGNVATVDFVIIRNGDDPENIPTPPAPVAMLANISGKVTQANDAEFFNDFMTIGNTLQDGKLTVKGTSTAVTSLTIAGEEVTIAPDGTWTKELTINEGTTEILYKAVSTVPFTKPLKQARVQTTVYETKTRIFWDKTAPTLVMTVTPDKDAQDIIWTKDGKVNLKGSISDNMFGSQVRINKEIVATYVDYDKMGADWNRIEFDHNVVMQDKEYIRVDAEDVVDFGNKIESILMQVRIDNEAPVIAITGPDDGALVKVTDNPAYAVTVTDNADSAPTVTLTLDGKPYVAGTPLAAGEHIFEVVATDKLGNSTSVKRTVTVYSAPTIDVTGAPTEFNVGDTVDKAALLSGVTASDAIDGDITASLTVLPETLDTSVLGVKTVKYTAVNKAGMMTEVEHTINIYGEITMTGIEPIQIEKDAKFYPLDGVKAYDRLGEELPRDAITFESKVNSAVPGDYVVTYTVTDNAGKTKTFTRVITVTATSTPLPGDIDPTEVVLRGYINGVTKAFAVGTEEAMNGAVSLYIELVDKQFAGYNTMAYECYLLDKDGVIVEPQGEIKLYLHMGDLNADKLETFYNPTDTDELQAVANFGVNSDNFAKLKVSHFSAYVLANKIELPVEPTPEPEPVDPSNPVKPEPAPQTGESHALPVGLLVTILGAVAYTLYLRRKVTAK